MKTIVSINLGNFGSTGRIMAGISQIAKSKGYTVYQAYPSSPNMPLIESYDIILHNFFWWRVNQKFAYWTGLNGYFNWWSTYKFLKKLDKIKPDILHLHNLHNSYINLPLLFQYIKKNRIKVIWTLHDCWAFTGHCPYFTLAKCDKWKTGCGGCAQLSIYPPIKWDTTAFLWNKKRKWFSGVQDMTLVTPSQWLAGLVKQSFLKEYPVKVIHNGIDLSIFKPTESAFRQKHHIQPTDKLILGVAMDWGRRKGLDIFIDLAPKLPKNYKIVLVGTNDSIDVALPDNILSIHKTHSVEELAAIYTAADVFVNPTREENFPTVNIESLACGTPVITFHTGGSPEILDEKSGSVVPCDDQAALLQEIIRVCETKPYKHEDCLARSKIFDKEKRFDEYVSIYYGENRTYDTKI